MGTEVKAPKASRNSANREETEMSPCYYSIDEKLPKILYEGSTRTDKSQDRKGKERCYCRGCHKWDPDGISLDRGEMKWKNLCEFFGTFNGLSLSLVKN